MDIRPIRTKEDHAAALKAVEADWDTEFSVGSPEGDRYEVLLTLVEAYEAKHSSLPDPNPIEAIGIRMEDLGLEDKDLLPIFGTRRRVHGVLNKARGLSVDHIRELHKRLGIPAGILFKKYKLKTPRAKKVNRKPHRKAA
jgi:HTH-type transcriptional regulator/antitoxin HigA